MTRVLIVGTSARAAAESAARVGFDVTALDAFGDLDQHPSVRAMSVQRDCGGGPFTARSAAGAAKSISCDAVTYLSPFENHPRIVGMLGRGRALWGNSPAVLRCVRDPIRVAHALRHRQLAVPAVLGADSEGAFDSRAGLRADRESDPGTDERWLVKPLASGGGHHVRARDRLGRVPRGYYLQERIPGTPGSVSFVAAGRRAVPLCISRQLVGDPAFGAAGYRYCGTILAPWGDSFERDDELVGKTYALAQAIAEEFDVVGVNGVDFVAREGNPYAVEVNPRWSASMELAERAYGISVFAAHAQACANGTLPVFDLSHARRHQSALGKAVVFARMDVTVGDTRQWTQDASVRDVPQPGERIAAGQPVCTVMAEQRTAAACYEALVRRAGLLYEELIPTT